MKIALMVGCFAALGMISAGAQAGFVDDDSKPQIVVIGKTAATEDAVGLGNNVPLRDALQQIVPRGYSQDTGSVNQDDLDRKVNWRGGKPWIDVLKDVMQGSPWITVKVDTTNKIVSLQAEGVQTTKSPVAASMTWRIRRGERISDALESWRKTAGWRGIYWEAQELESEIDQSFDGDFEQAVRTLLDTLVAQGIQIKARIFEANQVIRIMEKK